MAAPMDFNVPLCDKDTLLQKFEMAAKLGYGTVAINNFQPDLLVKDKKKGKKGQMVQSPDTIKIDEKFLKSTTVGISKLPKQLARLSAVLNDTASAHLLSEEMIQKYDLIAVTPTSEKTFLQACTELSIDIITIDVTERLGFKMRKSTVHAALERGISFELQYSPAIRDETMRRYFISNAQQIVFFCKGKNVILTSGCEKSFEMRGPHDVVNLGLLLDLTDPQAKDAVTRNCRAALLHSESRRSIKSVLKVENCANLPDKDKDWILNRCSVESNKELEKPDDVNEPLKKKAKVEIT